MTTSKRADADIHRIPFKLGDCRKFEILRQDLRTKSEILSSHWGIVDLIYSFYKIGNFCRYNIEDR